VEAPKKVGELRVLPSTVGSLGRSDVRALLDRGFELADHRVVRGVGIAGRLSDSDADVPVAIRLDRQRTLQLLGHGLSGLGLDGFFAGVGSM